MGNSAFSKEEIAYLYSLPAVSRVTSSSISYAEEFKRECTRRYLTGESPSRVFREAGLYPELIGHKRIERCVARWKARYAAELQDALSDRIVERSLEQDRAARRTGRSGQTGDGTRGADAGAGPGERAPGGDDTRGTTDPAGARDTMLPFVEGVTPDAGVMMLGQLRRRKSGRRSLADKLVSQQIRHIEELEDELARMRGRVTHLTTLLEQGVGITPADQATVAALDAAAGVHDRQGPGGGYDSGLTYEIYVVRRDRDGNLLDVSRFVAESQRAESAISAS